MRRETKRRPGRIVKYTWRNASGFYLGLYEVKDEIRYTLCKEPPPVVYMFHTKTEAIYLLDRAIQQGTIFPPMELVKFHIAV